MVSICFSKNEISSVYGSSFLFSSCRVHFLHRALIYGTPSSLSGHRKIYVYLLKMIKTRVHR